MNNPKFIFFAFVSFFILEVALSFKISADQRNLDQCIDLDSYINQSLTDFNVPGIAIGVLVDGHVVLNKGYGFRDLDRQLPVTEQTLFPIASCTTAFTSFILGQLVDEGKVSFDDPIRKYISEFLLSDQMTIRDLLTHRTGIEGNDPIWFFFDINRADVITLLQNLKPICDLRKEFRFNNFMYTIAGIVIERVTGQPWEEALSSRILIPLQMIHSNTSLEETQAVTDFSLPHAEINGDIKSIPFRSCPALNPAMGVYSNSSDIINWITLQLSKGTILNKKYINEKTLQEQHTVQIDFSRTSNQNEEIYYSGYGLGWYVGNYRGHLFLNSISKIDGFSSDISLLPEDKIGIIILTNSSSDGKYVISSVRNYIFDRLINLQDIDWMSRTNELREFNKQSLQEAEQQFSNDKRMANSDTLKDYVGRYKHPAYGIIEIITKEDQLISFYGKEVIPFRYKSTDSFMVKFSELVPYAINPIVDVTFFRNSLGNVIKLQIPFENYLLAKPIDFIRD